MSYREHLEAQKKYIRTKIEARQAKEERLRNPRPPRLDPPPAPTSKLAIAGFVLAMLLPSLVLLYTLTTTKKSLAEPQMPALWILGTKEEFTVIKNWLEPEILANELAWDLQHLTSREELVEFLSLGNSVDLMIIEAELALELHQAQALAPLFGRRETAWFEDCFSPLWEPEPFKKSLGWVIPHRGNIEYARHLFTLMRQFGTELNPEQIQQ